MHAWIVLHSQNTIHVENTSLPFCMIWTGFLCESSFETANSKKHNLHFYLTFVYSFTQSAGYFQCIWVIFAINIHLFEKERLKKKNVSLEVLFSELAVCKLITQENPEGRFTYSADLFIIALLHLHPHPTSLTLYGISVSVTLTVAQLQDTRSCKSIWTIPRTT